MWYVQNYFVSFSVFHYNINAIFAYNYVTGSGKIQHFADSIKIEILLYLVSIISELQVC